MGLLVIVHIIARHAQPFHVWVLHKKTTPKGGKVLALLESGFQSGIMARAPSSGSSERWQWSC